MELFKESEKVINFIVENGGVDIKEFMGEAKLSMRLFRKLYSLKHIYVNGGFLRKGLKLEKGDIVSIYMEDEEDHIIPEDFHIQVLYEDFDLLIINKEADMAVHLTRAHQKHTLSNGVSNYFKKNNIYRKMRFVNRLDKDTSGIVVVAKNPFAHQQMALQFKDDKVEKKYLAIVSGRVEGHEEYIDCPIEREEEGSFKRVVRADGKRSLSKYTVKRRYEKNSLLEVQIYTGRTHQIRVHLEHIGHPIVGDRLYGREDPDINRQALHSSYLKIKQPRTKEDIEIIAPLPRDMETLLNQYKRR